MCEGSWRIHINSPLLDLGALQGAKWERKSCEEDCYLTAGEQLEHTLLMQVVSAFAGWWAICASRRLNKGTSDSVAWSRWSYSCSFWIGELNKCREQRLLSSHLQLRHQFQAARCRWASRAAIKSFHCETYESSELALLWASSLSVDNAAGEEEGV